MPEMFVQQVSHIPALSLRRHAVSSNYLMQCYSMPLLPPPATVDGTGDEQLTQTGLSRIFSPVNSKGRGHLLSVRPALPNPVYYGLNYAYPPNNVTLFGNRVYTNDQIKMRSLGWTLVQYDRCPCRKRKSGTDTYKGTIYIYKPSNT